MTISDYRNTHSWQEAMALGPHLSRLAEELPAGEQMGLSWHLRQSLIEIPVAIAADLAAGSNTRATQLVRLAATLEMVERVYPALDGGPARQAVDELTKRLTSGSFAELVHQSETIAGDAPAATPALPAHSGSESRPQETYSVHVQADSIQ